jgi:hypothetical protein
MAMKSRHSRMGGRILVRTLAGAGMLLLAFCCWWFGLQQHGRRIADDGQNSKVGDTEKPAGANAPPPLIYHSTFYRKAAFEAYMAKALAGHATFNEVANLLTTMEDNCTRIVTDKMLALQQLIHLPKHLNQLEKHLKSVYQSEVAGHAGLFPGQMALYILLSRQPWVRQVCEIGFNAGHSALFWLLGDAKTKLISFDIAYMAYIKPMGIYLDAEFPRRLQTVWGDSKSEVPKFFQENNVTCDVIVVDGSHYRADVLSDLRHMQAAASSPRHLVILDDFLGTNDVGAAVIDARTEHLVGKLADCTAYPDTSRGMAFVYYKNKIGGI